MKTFYLLAVLLLFACQSSQTAETTPAVKVDEDCPEEMKTVPPPGETPRCFTSKEVQDKACEDRKSVALLRAEIAKEKDFGKRTGVVDAAKIYNHEKAIDLRKLDIDDLEKFHETKYKKKLSYKGCPWKRP